MAEQRRHSLGHIMWSEKVTSGCRSAGAVQTWGCTIIHGRNHFWGGDSVAWLNVILRIIAAKWSFVKCSPLVKVQGFTNTREESRIFDIN